MRINGHIALLNTASSRAIKIQRGTMPALGGGSPRLKANRALEIFSGPAEESLHAEVNEK